VIKMNTIGFYARSYISALNAAFTPFTELTPALNRNVTATRASQYDRAQAEKHPIARAA